MNVRKAFKYTKNTSEPIDSEKAHTYIKRLPHRHVVLHITHTETEAHERTAKHAESRLLPHVSARISARTNAAPLAAPPGEQHGAHARSSTVDPSRPQHAHRVALSTRALTGAAAARRWPRPLLPHKKEWPCAPGRARPRAHEPHGHLSWRSSGPDSGRLRPWRGARALREARCAKARTWARLS